MHGAPVFGLLKHTTELIRTPVTAAPSAMLEKVPMNFVDNSATSAVFVVIRLDL
jgi:hypothetical protein